MSIQVYEVVGFVAGAIGVYMAVPQARNIRKLGHGDGVSLTYWVVLLVVGASWFSYGLVIGSPSIIFSNFAGFTANTWVVTALLKRGWTSWLWIFAGAAGWVLLFKLLPLAVITVLLVGMTFNRIPQIARSVANLRNRVASAVSMKSQYYMLTAMALWEVYSLMSGHLSLLITTTTGFTLTLTVITLELIGRRRVLAATAESLPLA